MSEHPTKILVTVSGECFEAEYIRVGNADGRDGVIYCFHLQDLIKDRGMRNVSLFRSGTDRVIIEDYDARVETVRLNVIRRAFDSGSFSFETPIPPDHYHELPMRARDFQPRKKASDDVIRRFIKLGAYYLGFKYRPQAGPNLFVDFDCPEDLEYLGAKSDDIGRNVWFLTEKGYLQKSSAATFANPMRCMPTDGLIDEIEKGDVQPQPTGATVTQTFHIHGNNPRVNMNSTDNSVNIVTVSGDQLFDQIRETARSIGNESERTEILTKLDDLEQAQGTAGYQSAFQSFVASAANYMTIFGPFIPALTQLLSGQ